MQWCPAKRQAMALVHRDGQTHWPAIAFVSDLILAAADSLLSRLLTSITCRGGLGGRDRGSFTARLVSSSRRLVVFAGRTIPTASAPCDWTRGKSYRRQRVKVPTAVVRAIVRGASSLRVITGARPGASRVSNLSGQYSALDRVVRPSAGVLGGLADSIAAGPFRAHFVWCRPGKGSVPRVHLQ